MLRTVTHRGFVVDVLGGQVDLQPVQVGVVLLVHQRERREVIRDGEPAAASNNVCMHPTAGALVNRSAHSTNAAGDILPERHEASNGLSDGLVLVQKHCAKKCQTGRV